MMVMQVQNGETPPNLIKSTKLEIWLQLTTPDGIKHPGCNLSPSFCYRYHMQYYQIDMGYEQPGPL